MEATFRASDTILEQLVRARREDVVRMQQNRADQIADLESKGQSRLAELRRILPKDVVSVLDNQGKADDRANDAINAQLEEAKARLAASRPLPENETAPYPGLEGRQLIAANSLGWFSPYYGTLHGSDGKVDWQGYNPGNIDLWDNARGSGSGIFGTGSASFTVFMDWWFSYRAPQNRNYSHTIWVPFHGFYILYSDDGFWDSKETHARIDLSAVGYQYNYKGIGNTNVFDIDSKNINASDRFDGWRTIYYSDLLGADQAYLRVTSSFYVYARGGGSTAQLNFRDGDANFIGMPWVYVDSVVSQRFSEENELLRPEIRL